MAEVSYIISGSLYLLLTIDGHSYIHTCGNCDKPGNARVSGEAFQSASVNIPSKDHYLSKVLATSIQIRESDCGSLQMMQKYSYMCKADSVH